MPAPPITVQLSEFQQLEILRLELAAREEELHQTEAKIREVLFELERLKYLQGLNQLYQKQPQPQEAANLSQMQARREALRDALDALQAALSALEKETVGQTPHARGAGLGAPATSAGPKRRFDSFDDFKASRT